MTRPTPIIAIAAALAVILGVPFLFRPAEAQRSPDALPLVIVTPHNEQIRAEFANAFNRWHQARYGREVAIDWRTPGGTTDIRRQLTAEYEAALRNNALDLMSYDLLFGGGSYEHTKIKQGVSITLDNGEQRATPISAPVPELADRLDEIYGTNAIGRNTLYDPDLHWFGTALSSFGIVYNSQLLARPELGGRMPQTWSDLADPRLAGWVALANPAQSGSIATAFETILQRLGWTEGWRLLHRAAANSRYAAASSSKVPIDVSMGEAAAGMCIDFYGRYQAQAVRTADGNERVGYVDPKGLTDIDPDPVSLLRGAPNRETAVRFIEFCLSDFGQALWQFRVDDSPLTALVRAADGPATAMLPLGPQQFELRRMPAVRSIYARSEYTERFTDPVRPFDDAEAPDRWDRNYRAFIAPLFSSMAVNNQHLLNEAWRALNDAGPDHPRASEMQRLFDAMPTVTLDDGTHVALADPVALPTILARWSADASGRLRELDRIAWTTFYRENYRQILRLAGHGDSAD